VVPAPAFTPWGLSVPSSGAVGFTYADTAHFFGGYSAQGGFVAQHTAVRAKQVQDLTSSAGPSARAFAQVATVSAGALLYGGCDQTGPLDDLWLYAGGSWSALSVELGSPGPRCSGAAFASPSEDAFYVVGGVGPSLLESSATATLKDAWRLDATRSAWVRVCSGASRLPAARELGELERPVLLRVLAEAVEIGDGAMIRTISLPLLASLGKCVCFGVTLAVPTMQLAAAAAVLQDNFAASRGVFCAREPVARGARVWVETAEAVCADGVVTSQVRNLSRTEAACASGRFYLDSFGRLMFGELLVDADYRSEGLACVAGTQRTGIAYVISATLVARAISASAVGPRFTILAAATSALGVCLMDATQNFSFGVMFLVGASLRFVLLRETSALALQVIISVDYGVSVRNIVPVGGASAFALSSDSSSSPLVAVLTPAGDVNIYQLNGGQHTASLPGFVTSIVASATLSVCTGFVAYGSLVGAWGPAVSSRDAGVSVLAVLPGGVLVSAGQVVNGTYLSSFAAGAPEFVLVQVPIGGVPVSSVVGLVRSPGYVQLVERAIVPGGLVPRSFATAMVPAQYLTLDTLVAGFVTTLTAIDATFACAPTSSGFLAVTHSVEFTMSIDDYTDAVFGRLSGASSAGVLLAQTTPNLNGTVAPYVYIGDGMRWFSGANRDTYQNNNTVYFCQMNISDVARGQLARWKPNLQVPSSVVSPTLNIKRIAIKFTKPIATLTSVERYYAFFGDCSLQLQLISSVPPALPSIPRSVPEALTATRAALLQGLPPMAGFERLVEPAMLVTTSAGAYLRTMQRAAPAPPSPASEDAASESARSGSYESESSSYYSSSALSSSDDESPPGSPIRMTPRVR
jgi:hypothetical protein